MGDPRIYLGVVCSRINEGGRLLENVWRKKILIKISFFKFLPLTCIACSRFLGSIYTHLSDLDTFIILGST